MKPELSWDYVVFCLGYQSIRQFTNDFFPCLLLGLSIGLVGGFLTGLSGGISSAFGFWLGVGLSVGLFTMLAIGLDSGFIMGLFGGISSAFAVGLGTVLGVAIVFPILSLPITAFLILVGMELFFWFSEARPAQNENVLAFTAKAKIFWGLVSAYMIFQVQGIVIIGQYAYLWLSTNPKVVREYLGWFGVGVLMLVGLVVFVWVNSVKYRSRKKRR